MAERPPFALEEVFTSGFNTKLRQDEVPVGACVAGTQNFILDDDGKYRTRPGSRYFGTQISDTLGVGVSAGRLTRRDGTELPTITHGTHVRYLHPTVGTNSTPDWAILQTGYTSGKQFAFVPNDRSTDTANRLVITNGVDNYRIWRGNTGIVASFTANSITIAGSTSLADLLFPASGSISVDGLEFAYTGISGQTFTTVTPDPTTTAIAAGDALTDLPVQYASAPKFNIGLATDNARVIGANGLLTGIAIGGGQLVMSKTNDPTDFTFSTPRVATDGAILNVTEGGGTFTGLIQFENYYVLFKNKAVKKLAFSQDGEDIIQITPLLTYDEKTSDIGSVSAKAVFRAGNQIFFISPTNQILSLQRVERIDFPTPQPISDPIKVTTDACFFDTTSVGIGWRNRAYIACKQTSTDSANNIVLIYNFVYNCWESPMIGVSIADFFVYQAQLYALLASSGDVVQLWTGTNDFVSTTSVGTPINSTLVLGKRDYGSRAERKEFQQYWVQGEMYQNGKATININLDGNVRTCIISGTDKGIFAVQSSEGTFGGEEFGVETFGPSGSDAAAASMPLEFKVILTSKRLVFDEAQLSIETSAYFKLLAHGPRVAKSNVQQPASRKRALIASS